MEKVIPIRLSGHEAQYEVEESAYQLLQRYLAEARSRLGTDPDREEIIADLEQAIGDKLAGLKQAGRSQLSLADVQTVLDEIGAVEGDSATEPTPAGPTHTPQRRLYRIREGQWFAGVCTGLAAYSGIELGWVRTIFLLLTLVTGGGLILVYLVMMFALPVVETRADYRRLTATPA